MGSLGEFLLTKSSKKLIVCVMFKSSSTKVTFLMSKIEGGSRALLMSPLLSQSKNSVGQFLAALSNSRSLVVRPSVRRSVGHLCEKVTFKVSNGVVTVVTVVIVVTVVTVVCFCPFPTSVYMNPRWTDDRFIYGP